MRLTAVDNSRREAAIRALTLQPDLALPALRAARKTGEGLKLFFDDVYRRHAGKKDFFKRDDLAVIVPKSFWAKQSSQTVTIHQGRLF
jgi:hypothetical protein